MEEIRVIALRLGSCEIQRDHLYVVQASVTAEEIRQKYNKCIDVLKKEELDKPFHNEEDFISNYLKEEYGWIPIVPNYIVHDAYESYGKIENQEFNKVYLEER